MDGHQPDVVQPRAEFENLPFLLGQMQCFRQCQTDLMDAAPDCPGRIKRLEHMQTQLYRVLQIFGERLVELAEGFILLGDAGQLQFQGPVGFEQLAVHHHGLGLQYGVAVDQLVALRGVLDGGEQFFAQPGLTMKR